MNEKIVLQAIKDNKTVADIPSSYLRNLRIDSYFSVVETEYLFKEFHEIRNYLEKYKNETKDSIIMLYSFNMRNMSFFRYFIQKTIGKEYANIINLLFIKGKLCNLDDEMFNVISEEYIKHLMETKDGKLLAHLFQLYYHNDKELDKGLMRDINISEDDRSVIMGRLAKVNIKKDYIDCIYDYFEDDFMLMLLFIYHSGREEVDEFKKILEIS